MAHFAELDENDIVIRVIVINNAELLDESGNEAEEKGIEFCKSLYGENTKWKQTSYNNKFRVRYAGVGYHYNESLDAFIAPKLTNDDYWILDAETASWIPSTPKPSNDAVYRWDVINKEWKYINKPFESWIMGGNPLSWLPPVPYPTDGKPYMWDESILNWKLINLT